MNIFHVQVGNVSAPSLDTAFEEWKAMKLFLDNCASGFFSVSPLAMAEVVRLRDGLRCKVVG